jgi:hypothetical protein
MSAQQTAPHAIRAYRTHGLLAARLCSGLGWGRCKGAAHRSFGDLVVVATVSFTRQTVPRALLLLATR